MPLVKITCPNCGQSLTIDKSLNLKTCPACGGSLVFNNERVIDNGDLFSLDREEVINKGLFAIKHEKFDDLEKIYNVLKESGEDFYLTLFEMFLKIRMDVIFKTPDMPFTLSNKEMDDDLRSRYYHYARKKYITISQVMFDQIAGKYPDIPGDSRGKWKRSRTAYDDKYEKLSHYDEIASLIRGEYMDKLNSYPLKERETNIIHNLNVFMDMVSHYKIDLYGYNKEAQKHVLKDYNDTPNPGNRLKFTYYIILFILSFLGLVLNVTEWIILSILGNGFNGVLRIVIASVSVSLYIIGVILMLLKGKLLLRSPFVGIALIIGGLSISVGGILASIFSVALWFNITTVVISLIVLFISILKLQRYVPHKTNKNNTVIGSFESLVDESFDSGFKYHFSFYKGDKYNKVK